MSQSYDPAREELFQIDGDAPDPLGGNLRGKESTLDFTKGAFAHPMIRYRDMILEGDLYRTTDELTLIILCPRCRRSLKISSKNKQMDFDPSRGLSVEPFRCTWELDENRQAFGLSMCNWTVAIDRNIAKDA